MLNIRQKALLALLKSNNCDFDFSMLSAEDWYSIKQESIAQAVPLLAFDGTVIVVSHDREFLDGLVTKVYEFGGGCVREHIGGIYDFLKKKDVESQNSVNDEVIDEPTFTESVENDNGNFNDEITLL